MRTVPEWRGAHDNAKVPPRRKAGEPLTVEFFRAASHADPETGCWLWQKAVARNGYGVLRIGDRTTRAHRAAYQVTRGVELPRNVDVCHRCDVRRCVNPDHLFAGSRADNMADCSRKGRIRLPGLIGEACPASKLSADQVRAIRLDQRSNRAVARAYGVDKGTISSIRRGLTWRSVA